MTGFFRPVTTDRQANNHCQYVDYSFIDTISLSNLLFLLVGPSLRWCILLLATTLDSRYRYRLLINARRSAQVQDVIREWIGALKFPQGVRVTIDIDPYSFV